MANVFSKKEIEILELYLKNKKNKEIAEELDVSEPYISQTLSKIRIKLESIEDSLELLEGLGIVNAISPMRLTETGRKSFPNKLTSLESSKKSQLSKSEDKKINYEVALPAAPSFNNVIDVTPIFGSPHDHLKYTVTELVKGILNQSLESTRELSVRLGIAEDIIHDVETTIQYNLPKTVPSRFIWSNDSGNIAAFSGESNAAFSGEFVATSYPTQFGESTGIGGVAVRRGDQEHFQNPHDIYVTGVARALGVGSSLSMQVPSSNEHKRKTVITSITGSGGDMYGR